MKISKNYLRTIAALSVIATSMIGCTDTDSRAGEDDDRAVGYAAVANTALTVYGALGNGVTLASFFGADGGPQVVDLSEQALEEIEAIVKDTTVTFAYEQYNNEIESLVRDIETITTTDCDVAEPACQTELSNDSQTLTLYATEVNGLWASFTSDEQMHSVQRLKHLPQSMLLGGLRAKLLEERAIVDQNRGYDAEESREIACEEAKYHASVLKEIETEDYSAYADGSFSDVYSKLVEDEFTGSGIRVYAIGCFEGPSASDENVIQEWCEPDNTFNRRRYDCNYDDCGWTENERGDTIMNDTSYHPEAEDIRDDEVARFYDQMRDAVIGGDSFDDLVERLEDMPVCSIGAPTADLQPVTASSGGELINKLFGHVSGTNPGLMFGAFDPSDSSVKATADSGYFKILLAMDDEVGVGDLSGVNNTIVVESDAPLREWIWYNSDFGLVGTGMVWGADGWISHDFSAIDEPHHPEAAKFQDSYYYLIDIENATLPYYPLAFLSSIDQAATVKFYAKTIH
ncbi:MAG: hypothetical protein AAGF11_50565 [Myxococcota bacterium]